MRNRRNQRNGNHIQNFLRQTSCVTLCFPSSTCSLALEKPSTSPTEAQRISNSFWSPCSRLVCGNEARQVASRCWCLPNGTSTRPLHHPDIPRHPLVRYCMSADMCSMRVEAFGMYSHYVGSDPNVMPHPSEIFIV